MSSKSKLVLIGMAIFSLIAFSSLQAALVYVDNSGGTPQSYATIQAGVDAAGDGDTIHVVFTGTAYAGATLTGRNGLRIGADPGVEMQGTSGIGFDLNNSNNNKISGFEIYDFDKGVNLVGGSDNNEIYSNIFHNNGWGVYSTGSGETGNYIHDNCFFRHTNSHQCYDNNATANANTWDDNYWDDWTGSPSWYGIEPASPYITADYNPKAIWNMVQVKPATSDVAHNTDFDVYIEFIPPSACNYTPVDLMSIEYNVTFDNTKLSYVSAQNADDLFPNGATTNTIITPGTGTINIAQTFLAGAGAPGPGDMVKITFHGDNLVTGSNVCITVVNCIDVGSNPIVTYTACGVVNVKDMVKPVITKIEPASGGTYGPTAPDFDSLNATDDLGLYRIYYEMSPGFTQINGTLPSPLLTRNFQDYGDYLFAVHEPWASLPEGTDTIWFKVQDWYGGNYSDPVMWVFTKDVTPPSFTGVALADIQASVPAEPGWSNDLDVQLTITAGPDAFEMHLTGDITSPTTGTWLPFAAVSTVTLTSGDAVKTVNVWVRDIYTNQTGPLSTTIELDQFSPTFTGFVLDVGVTYNTTGTASGAFLGYAWDVAGHHFWKFELTGDLSAPTGWNSAVDPVSLTLSAGDGTKSISAVIRDKAGNVSGPFSDDIIMDLTSPSATITLKSKSASTVPPYSTVYTPTNPVTCEISATGTPAWMRLSNEAGFITGVIAFSTPVDAALWWVSGLRTISVELWDVAWNKGGPFVGSITVDVTPPAFPGSFAAVPGGSVELSWTNDAQVAKTRLIKTPWNGYPDYPPPAPSYPATKDASFFVADVDAPGNTYNYAPGIKDIYYFSAFAMDSAGNWSGAANDNATSYTLGDIVIDGCVDWDDVEYFSDHFNTVSPAAGYDAECDFHPTDDGTESGIPQPDLDVDFGDLVILALNYDGDQQGKIVPTSSAPIVLNLNLGDGVPVGNEFEAKLTINDANSVKAMHIVLDYDNSTLKLLGVTRGELLTGSSILFFADKEKVDISLVKLGKGLVIGGSGEVATLKFKRLSAGTVELTPNVLDLRDVKGEPMECGFNTISLKSVPTAFALSQNYPNPFNPNTQIAFALPVGSKVTLKIYNIAGQLVKTLVNADLAAGHHTITWNGTNSSGSEVGTGIYFYRLETGKFTSVKKMVFVK